MKNKVYLIYLFFLNFANAEMLIDIDEVIETSIETNDSVFNMGTIISDNNNIKGDFINDFGANLETTNSFFANVYNDGFIDGKNNEMQEVINNGFLLGEKQKVLGDFYNTYDGMVDGNAHIFKNTYNYGLIYGDNHQFDTFTNYTDGWIIGNHLTFNGNVLNDNNGMIAGDDINFNAKLINNSYIYIDNTANFNTVENYSIIEGLNLKFNEEVKNTDTISAEDITFSKHLNNTTDSMVSASRLNLASVENNGMILGNNAVFKGKLTNYKEGWVIGSDIRFDDIVDNYGDIVGSDMTFAKALNNYANIDIMNSTLSDINNQNELNIYTSSINGKISQIKDAKFYANASTLEANINGGNYMLEYSKVKNNEIDADSMILTKTTIDSKNIKLSTLSTYESTIYGGIRVSKLNAVNTNFVAYFNDGFSGAIVVDDELYATNNIIKILNYQDDLAFYPILLARSSKDLSKDFQISALKGFTDFGFKNDKLTSKFENGIMLIGVGDLNSLGINNLEELFNKEDLTLNNAKETINTSDVLEISGINNDVVSNLYQNFYKESYSRFSLFDHFDIYDLKDFGYSFKSGSYKDINYYENYINLSKINEYNYFTNKIGIFSFINKSDINDIKGGGFFSAFKRGYLYLSFIYQYAEFNPDFNILDFGNFKSNYYSNQLATMLSYEFSDYVSIIPSIGIIYEYLPSYTFKNENLKAEFQKHNFIYSKIGLKLKKEYLDSFLELGFDYYQELSKARKLYLDDYYSKLVKNIEKYKELKLYFNSNYNFNDKVFLDLKLSKNIKNDSSAYDFKLSLEYKFK